MKLPVDLLYVAFSAMGGLAMAQRIDPSLAVGSWKLSAVYDLFDAAMYAALVSLGGGTGAR